MHKSNYKQEIWHRIKKRIARKSGARNTVIISVLAFLIINGIAYILLLRWVGIDTANQDIILPIAVSTGIEILMIASILAYWRYDEIPEEIYEEQVRRIKQFWPETLDIRVYDSGIRDYIDNAGNNLKIIGFEVVNTGKKIKIVELETTINSIWQTWIDSDTAKPVTTPFLLSQKCNWENGRTQVDLRPDDRSSFLAAFLSIESPVRVRFGEGGYMSYLFEQEAVYQLEMQFWGKLEGEKEFKQYNYMNVIYSKPSEKILLIGHEAKRLYNNIPQPFLEVIAVAERGLNLRY